MKCDGETALEKKFFKKIVSWNERKKWNEVVITVGLAADGLVAQLLLFTVDLVDLGLVHQIEHDSLAQSAQTRGPLAAAELDRSHARSHIALVWLGQTRTGEGVLAAAHANAVGLKMLFGATDLLEKFRVFELFEAATGHGFVFLVEVMVQSESHSLARIASMLLTKLNFNWIVELSWILNEFKNLAVDV